MHELSVALSIIDIVEEYVSREGETRIDAVHLRVGPLAGVIREALLSAYTLACEGTRLEGSRLQIEDVPLVVYCPQCRAEQSLETIQALCCPVCGTLTGEIIQGNELEVAALEILE